MVAYRCAASCEPTKTKPERESLDEGIFRATDLLQRICDTCSSDQYRIFISGDRNFRKLLYPEYKANRLHLPRPAYLDSLRELLVREWNAEVVDGYEADDGIGMAHSEHTIVVSNDKDFFQLPGTIFNPVKSEFSTVSNDEASFNFYLQMLKGDASDNVSGVAGIGEVRGRRILHDCLPSEMHSRVYALYDDPRRFFLNFRLLRILRSREEYEEIMVELDEDSERKEQGEATTEISGTEDTGNIPGANQE
jgi:5'-3' exonuclease